MSFIPNEFLWRSIIWALPLQQLCGMAKTLPPLPTSVNANNQKQEDYLGAYEV